MSCIGVFEGGKEELCPPNSFLAPPKIFNYAVTRKQVASRSRESTHNTIIYCYYAMYNCSMGCTCPLHTVFIQ